MKGLKYVLALAAVFFCLPPAAAVQIDFDLPSGTLTPNPPADIGPPDNYYSGTIPLPGGPLVIEPGVRKGIWIKFKDMLHLEVIDRPPNSDGVERLQTHVRGRVVPDPNDPNDTFTNLWVDVILTGVMGHIRESFMDPNEPHPERPPLGQPGSGPGDQRPSLPGDDPTGDWDGAFDDSGTDLWGLFHEDIVVDKESHAVAGGFTLGTWADDLTDERFLFHDIHWEITNHGDNAVEIFEVEFWQDGNFVRIGEWVPEPSTVTLFGLASLFGLAVARRRND